MIARTDVNTIKARQHKMEPDARYHEDMARLYRQEVLKEQPTLQIQGLGGGKKKQPQAVLHKPTV